ncbi:hypothetical protein EDB85DRAFT_2203617 [Lactarius pseudohatsudake]|nr:hypothetical protein EDB85DRAFT_2203617 [Lactarius pseudohatsudake]
MYYDEEEDDDPYAPCTGPAAMPSPRSKYAPYYLGCTDSFEDFLEQYEGLVYDCALTDPQRVDVLIRYVAPSLRDFWRSLNRYRSHNWPLFRQSLIDVFSNPTPRHQIMRQKLHSHVQETSRTRMHCEDDVLRYYRQFICFGLPLVHAGHLSEEERNTAFWYGFHPLDREVLQPRLLGKNPSQPPDVPFHFEDVLSRARAAFAYVDYFPSWLHAKQFQSPSVRREQPVVEPIPQDAYSFRAVTCAVATYAETTPELPPSSYSMPDSDLPLSSISPSESQYTQVPSVTPDQPEPAYTLSTTLPPSDSPLSFTPALVHLASDSDSIPTSTPPSFSLMPSAFPTPTHTDLLARSDVEILTTSPSPSITPAPFSMPMSDSEYLPSATVDQPTPTLSSTSPSSSSISPMFVPSATEDQSEPEPEPALFASVPTLPSTPSHVHSATDYGTIFASTPPSSSPTLSPCLPSVTEEQPEAKTESIPSITPASTFALTPLSSSTFLPSPVSMRSAMNSQPEIESALVSESAIPPSIDHAEITSAPGLSLHPSDPPANLVPSPSTSILLPVLSASSDFPPASASPSLVLGNLELESSPAFAPSDVVTLSHPEPSWSSPCESVPLLLTQHEASVTIPTPRHSTLPQRPPRIKTLDSDSSPLEVTAAPTSPATPFVPQAQEPPMVHEVTPTLTLHLPLTLPPLALSHSGSVRFNFALVFITMAVLVSAFFNVSATLSTLARKFRSKNEDLGGSQNGAFKTSKSRNIPVHRLRLGQNTPRAPRLVFNPGGPASNSRLPSAHAKTFDSARR